MASLGVVDSSGKPYRASRFLAKRNPEWKQWPSDDELLIDPRPLPGFEDPSHPEIEDQSLLEWGMQQSLMVTEGRPDISVLHGYETQLEWEENVDDLELEAIVSKPPFENSSPPNDGSRSHFSVFFINTLETSPSGWLPGNFSLGPKTVATLRKAGLSTTILCALYSSEGYWAKMGNHRLLRRDSNGSLSSFELSYRYAAGWDIGISFTQFIRSKFNRTYICINYPASARRRFIAYVQQNPNLVYRDFFLDALAADDSLKTWQANIGARRTALLGHERKYEDDSIDFNLATRQLHRLSRDWHTLHQDLIDLHAQLEFLQKSYDKYNKTLRNLIWDTDTSANIDESFDVLKSQCDNYARWTVVYKERTNIRINLLFYLANQRESRTSTQIASSTAKVAEQTQRDSASMITIAAVTMFFLPGTFVSAILSTTFFDYGSEALQVSRKWWILPAVTIPLMFVTFAVWLGWQWWRFGKFNLRAAPPSGMSTKTSF